jgi:diamine N-acetyltransferase
MLRGERVLLRAVERADLQRLHELMNREIDQVVLGYGTWRPRPLAEFEHRYNKDLEQGEQYWMAIEVDGVVIGDCGLKGWSADRRSGTIELGISIFDPAYLGQGYGREAVRLLLDWGFRIQNWRKIWLSVLGSNERALRSYRAVGFVEEGRQRQHDYHNGAYHDLVLMGVLRDEWLAARTTTDH